MNPVEAIPDEFGHVKAMAFTRADGSRIELPARTVLVAAGTVPNVTYEKEHPGIVLARQQAEVLPGLQGGQEAGRLASRWSRTPNGFFTSHDTGGKFVTYYGDNHPRYNGNVVKAMASAKHGYPHVVALVRRSRSRRSIRRSSRSARTRGDRWSRSSTISCWRASSGSCA